MSLQQTTQTTPPADVVDFGVGQPGFDLLPLALFKQAAADRFASADPSLLAYGAEQGDGYLRTALAEFLGRAYALAVDPTHLFITAGASQCIDWLCTLYTRYGDTIFVEEPSYMYAYRIFSDHGLKVVGIPTDEHGIIISEVEAALQRERPAFLYVIPTFQNPSGTTLPLERREQLASLSHAYNFLLIADEVYHCLHFDSPPPQPMAAHSAEGRIVSLGSFAKILAPGLRLGWIQAPPAMIQRMTVSGVVDSGGGLNPIPSALVRTLLEQGRLEGFVDQLRATYRARARALSTALREEVGEWVTFREPQGGFFLWAELPATIDASQLRREADRFKVAFQPGVLASTCGEQQHHMRLSYTYYDIPLLLEGVKRLRRLLEAHG